MPQGNSQKGYRKAREIMKPRNFFLAIVLSLLCVPAIANTLSNRGDVPEESSSSSAIRLPEPGTLVLLLSALGGLSGYYVLGRKKR